MLHGARLDVLEAGRGGAVAAHAPMAEPPQAAPRIELSVANLLASLEIPINHVEKIGLRPEDVVFGFVAQNVGAGRPMARVYSDIAHVMSSRGQPTLTVAYFRRSLACSPDREIHDRLFHALMISPETTNESMLADAKAWSEIYAAPGSHGRNFEIDRDPKRPLRIGYVCNFFYGLGTRIGHLPMMMRHDKSHFEVIAYSDSDDVADDLGVASIWRSTEKLNDDAFAQLVLNDRVDILVELNGRGGRNRFDAFAQRLAPIQINFGNFLATTGLPAVDYTIVHEVSVPPEDDRFYTEKVYRLKCMAVDFIQCWPPDFFPPVAPPPYRKAGRITFGCFGGSVKVDEKLIETWCNIVKRVKGARFYYKSMSLSDPGTLNVFRGIFERHGLSGDQIMFEGSSDHRTMLELYSHVDIALDTFPYNGGNTTLEALWQGIPVVTLKGDRWASRTGAGLMALGGFDEFVANTSREYEDMAVRLAADHDFLEHFRTTSRERLRGSRLFDMAEFTREIEQAYRTMWREWLKAHPTNVGA